MRTSESTDTSNLLNLVWLWFRSPHFGLAATTMRTSEPPHQSITASARVLLENPERGGRKFHVIELVPKRRGGIGAHRDRILHEQELPTLADEHLRLQRHQDAIGARPAAESHTFQADHAGCLLPG